MRSYKSEVKEYKRKKYTQYLINLKKDHPFNKDETVLIYPESEISAIMDDNKSHETTIKQQELIINELNEMIKSLEALEEFKTKYERLLNEHDKLRNSKDHLQERFNKSQDEVIQLQKMINRLTNLTLFDRLFNRIPEDIKELNAAPGE